MGWWWWEVYWDHWWWRDIVRGRLGEPRHKPETDWTAGISRATRGRSGLKRAQGLGGGKVHHENQNTIMTNPCCIQSDLGSLSCHHSVFGQVHSQLPARIIVPTLFKLLTLPTTCSHPALVRVRLDPASVPGPFPIAPSERLHAQ